MDAMTEKQDAKQHLQSGAHSQLTHPPSGTETPSSQESQLDMFLNIQNRISQVS